MGNNSRRMEAVKSFKQIQKQAISQVKTSGLICIAHRQSHQVLSRSHYGSRAEEQSREITSDDVADLNVGSVQMKSAQFTQARIFNLLIMISIKIHY